MPRPLRPKEPDGPPDEHLPSSRIGHCWWVPVETRTVQFDSVYRDLHHVWCVFVPEAVRRQAYFNDKPHLRNQGFGITLLPQIAAACGTQPGFKIFRLQWLDTGHIARESIDMVCDFKENFKYYRVRAIDNVGWGGSDRGSNIAGSWIDLFDHWKDPAKSRDILKYLANDATYESSPQLRLDILALDGQPLRRILTQEEWIKFNELAWFRHRQVQAGPSN